MVKKDTKKKLTRKQQAFVNELIKNPKQSATEAVRKTMNVTTVSSATSRANELMTNPDIRSYLAEHSTNIEETLTKNFYNLANSDNLEEIKEGNRVGMWIHDKIHGKATQKTENTSVKLSIDAVLDELS